MGVKKLVPNWNPRRNYGCEFVRGGAYVRLVGCVDLSDWNW